MMFGFDVGAGTGDYGRHLFILKAKLQNAVVSVVKNSQRSSPHKTSFIGL
jgi:hypothetical protein